MCPRSEPPSAALFFSGRALQYGHGSAPACIGTTPLRSRAAFDLVSPTRAAVSSRELTQTIIEAMTILGSYGEPWLHARGVTLICIVRQPIPTSKAPLSKRLPVVFERRFAGDSLPVFYGDSRRFEAIRGDAPFAGVQDSLVFTRSLPLVAHAKTPRAGFF